MRLVPGVLGHEESAAQESFEQGGLDHPHYTRPPSWRGRTVPDVPSPPDTGSTVEDALSGWLNAEEIAAWKS